MSPLTRLAWWWLRWRGWAVQVNTADSRSRHRYVKDGREYDAGWQPWAFIRYGRVPVYRVGPERFVEAGLIEEEREAV